MSIRAYQVNHLNTTNLPKFTALLLDKAASHIESALEAMKVMDYEKRVHLSNLASDILQGLQDHVVRLNPEQAKVAQALENYYSDMIILITRMNVKNDMETAQAIAKSLRDVADIWRSIGYQIAPTNVAQTETDHPVQSLSLNKSLA